MADGGRRGFAAGGEGVFVPIEYECNLPQFMHGSRYNLLGCKKKLDMRMNIYSMFKLTTKIDAPFYI